MSRDTTVIAFRQPEAIDDPLTEVAREGARRMLAQVLIAEADAFVALWKDLKLPDGRDRIVRHGHGPHRAIQTGVGPVEVRRAKVRDRGDVGAEEKIRFTSSILPKWARRTKSLDALLPVLYLRGVSTGDFQEVLTALLGKDAHSDDGDQPFRRIATTHSDRSRPVWCGVKAPLDAFADFSVRASASSAVEPVPVVNRRDPRATRSAPTADAAARAGGPC